MLLDKIPPEIRNSIWRNVLVSSDPIHVTKDQPHQPSLLRTCTQVREEASSIYFNENQFELPMVGFDSTLGLKWCTMAKPYLQKSVAKVADLGRDRESGTETWADLKVWLQRAHAGEVPRYVPDGRYTIGCDENAEELFDAMDELRDKSWAEAAQVLESCKDDIEEAEGVQYPLFDNPGSDCDW